MELVRAVPGWKYVAPVQCFQCDCGAYVIRNALVEQTPVARPHAQPHLTKYDAIPGTDMLADGPNMQPST
jgi:hypothetical protein